MADQPSSSSSSQLLEDDDEVGWGPFEFFDCPLSSSPPASFRLHYQRTGSPEAQNKIVFIMGLVGTRRAWDSQILFFKNPPNSNLFECLFVDNRGVGLSDVPPGPYAIQEMAEDIVLLTQHIGWERFRSNLHIASFIFLLSILPFFIHFSHVHYVQVQRCGCLNGRHDRTTRRPPLALRHPSFTHQYEGSIVLVVPPPFLLRSL